MKNKLHLTLIILAITIFAACSNNDNSDLSIISNQGNIQWKSIDSFEQLDDDIKKESFNFAFQNDFDQEIYYFNIGDKLELSFDGIRPDTIAVFDTLLNDIGSLKYEDRLTVEIPVEEIDGKYFIRIDENFASGLSSLYIENQLVYRGYRIDVNTTEGERSYLFVIKTVVLFGSPLDK